MKTRPMTCLFCREQKTTWRSAEGLCKLCYAEPLVVEIAHRRIAEANEPPVPAEPLPGQRGSDEWFAALQNRVANGYSLFGSGERRRELP